MSGQGHTAECRKRLEDVMMTDTSTATRIKETRVVFGTTNPSSSSGSGQRERVRFSDQDLETKPDRHEAPVTRKRSAETHGKRLEEETAETAEADADKRIAVKRKRKAENDPSDSEVEDSAMNLLADLWHRRDRYVASVRDTSGKLLNNTLVEKARAEEISVIREFGVWEGG